MSDFLKRRIQERDGQRRGTQETSAPASSFLQQRIQQRDTQRAESGYRAPRGTHKTMLGMSLEEYKAKLDEALAAWKSTSATTESGLANPKEAQARKTYQTMRKQYKALQQRESEKQQAQAAQQEYDELRVADLNALKEKMDAAKESADGSAKERVVAGSIVKQKDSGAQAVYEEAARKYNLAQQIQYDEKGEQALAKLSIDTADAVDTLIRSPETGTSVMSTGLTRDRKRSEATQTLERAGYTQQEISDLVNWRQRQIDREKYQKAVENREKLAKGGFLGAAAATLLSVPETLASGVGVADLAMQNAMNSGTDRPANYYSAAMRPYAKANTARSTISQKLEQNTDAEIFGQNIAAGAYNIGTSMLDSTAVAGLAALGVPPLAATSLLGGSAATSAMVDAKDRGVSDEQAVLTGLAAGVAESLFEEVSLEKLLKLKPAVGTLGQRVRTTIKNVGLQAATEGSEEFFTTLANTMTDNLINGGLSDFQQNLREYMEQGMSEDEARRRAYLDFAGQLALDFGGGAIAGGLMAGGQTAVQTGQRNAAIAQEYGDIARGAAQERLDTNEGDRLAQDVQNRVSSNRRVGGGAIAELVSRNVQAQNAQTQTAIAEAAAQRLTELGETENVETVAQAAAQLTADPTMSAGRRRAAENVLKGSRYGERVLGELTEGMQADSAESAPAAVQEQSAVPSAEQVRQAVESTQRSRGAQNLTESRGSEERTQSGRRFASEWAGNLPQVLTEDAYVRRLKELRVNPQATDSRTVTGTAYNKESGKLDVIVRGTDGKTETIPAAKAATTARQERLMDLAADVGEAGPQMFAAIRDGQDVETYARQWKNAYTYGESNIPRAYAMQSDAVKYLTAEQRDIAYEAGKAAFEQKQAQAREKRAAKGNDTPKAQKGTVKLTGAVIGGKRYDGVSKASLTERQRANLKVLGQVAQATGVDIVLYQSRANARGEYEGQNGAYKDGTLYLDINAGRNRVGDLSEVAVVRTAAHELTHFIQDYNPAAYAEYRDYVVGLLTEEQGMDFDALVEHKQALQNDLSYDEAVDEVVADGSEMLLRDTAAVQRLAEENRGLFQKIRSWLRKWLENIKKAFGGVGAEHAEAKALEKHLEELQKRWDDALVGASRNLQRSKAEAAESDGEKASVRGKYWRPDLNRSEWSLLNRRLEEEIESSGQYLDESTKWLYADEKGVQVFALYGIGDGTEATPLYAVGGKQARYAASLMQDVIEEVGRSDGNAEGFDSWAENLRSKNGNYRRNYAQAGDGKPAGRNAGLHGRSQGRNTGKPAGDGKGKSSGVREKFSLRDSAGRELTAAQQDYFRDSQVRDADGNLLVMYHQTEGAFTVFDTRHKGAGTGDDETPFGIFLKRTARDIGVRGKNQMELYANIRNPLRVRDRAELVERLRELSGTYAELKDQSGKIDKEYGAKFAEAKAAFKNFLLQWRKENPDAPSRAAYDAEGFDAAFDAEDNVVKEWTQKKDELALRAKEAITDALRKNGYDGVILESDRGSWGRSTDAYIALDANQVKNVTNQNPTEDPDIRYSARDYGLTEDEEHAIVSYKSGDSYSLNGKLATGGELTELQRSLRDHLDTALEKLPVYRGTVYRHYDFDSFGGYDAMAEFLSQFTKGRAVPMSSYLSASTVRNEDRTNGEYTVDMVIQSETGRSLNGFGRNTENEVLLSRTTELIADSMELISPHKVRITAREVVKNGTGTAADSASVGVRDVRESAQRTDGLRQVSGRNPGGVQTESGRSAGRDGNTGLPGLREGTRPGSMGESGVESDYRAAEEGLKYQPREQSVSDRQILANALERVAQNERERSILADYREKAAKMAFYERELAKREQKIADHRSGKAVLEPDKIRRAEVSAQKYAALISQQDERLLRLEKLKPLRDVVTRERDYIAERLRGAAEEKSRYTEEFERQLSEERRRGEERLQQYRKGREERDDIRVERRQIEKLAKRLTTYLEENTDKKHIPEALKKPIGELLQSLDFSSRTKLSSGAATKADLAYIRSMQRIEAVLAAQERFDETGEGGDLITGTLDLPKGFREALTEQIERVQTIMETHQPGERAVMRMNLTDLRKLKTMLSTLSSAVTKMNELFANGRFRHVDQAAQDTIFTLREKGQHQSLLPKVESFVRWDNTLPWYAFQRLGEGGQSIFAELQDGWDKLAFNTQKILEFRKELIDDKTARKWDTEVHEVELTDQDDNTVKAKLTTAQLMSLYCLSRRKQALGHLLGGGIRPADIELTANIKDKVLKKTEKQDTHYHLTDERLGQLLGLLTDEQREIAQKMQKYMTEQGATWGNEITMARWGYRAFTEENYFPLTTDREDRPARADDASEGSLYRLQNISATKPLTQNANNAVMLYSIFDVYADHMADMAKYNAMVLPILDAQKWYNYKEGHKNEAGQVSTWTVQRTLTQVYGRDANRFVIQFLKDLNGVKENGARGEGLAKKMIQNYKRAAVAANLRVALLQPTAYVRASAVLDAKYLTRAFGERTSTKEATAEMLARSGIGLWKSMGMFDTDVGRSIRDQIKGKGSAVESLVDKTMVLAEKGDSITWARLWRACKLEVADKQHLSGEQLLDATAKRFREVIYRTQVIDSTMTRSHMMRSGSTFAAIFTSFMSEPTVSYNLIMTASEKIWEDTKKYGAKMAVKRNWKTAGRAWQAYILSAVASAMVEALADAWRDPGDDKDTQKLLNAFRDNLGSNLNPLNKLPGLRDIFSIFEGYDTNRTDMAAFSNLNKAIAIWKETVQLAEGTIDEATDTTYHGNMTIYGKVYKTAQALSQLSGLPVSATMREAQALWNNTVGRWAPGLKQKTYDNEKQRLIQKAGTAMWNGDKDAWQDAYAALEQYMLADGKSKREAESAVYSEMRKAVKDSYLAGELTETEARQKLVDFLGSDAEKAAQQVTSWKNGSEFAKEVGFEYGEMRSAYETGRIQKSEAVRLRQKYGGETQDEAESKVRYWDFCIEYPQYDDISEARANKYYDYCRQAGVGVAAYYKAAQYTAAIVSEKDENGNNVSGSVKRQYVEYIQSLGLSAAQQKALWQALKNATWSDKGTPWE
jgi:hypothetical protein